MTSDGGDGEPVILASNAHGMVRWVLLGAALLTACLLAALAFTMDRDEPVERAIPLPEPSPPRTKALVAPTGNGVGWSWVNPLPRAMASWHDVDLGASEQLALVGFGGDAARFHRGTMFRWRTGTEASLQGVAWRNAGEVIAVGEEGTVRILRIAGEPRAVESGTSAALRDVVATSADEAWIAGDDGTLLHLVGDAIEPLETGTRRDLLGLALRGDTVWVVGEAGALYRLREGVLTEETSGTEATLRAVGGCARGDLYAVGDEGRLLRRRRDGRWEILDSTYREPWAAIGCDRERAVAVSLRGGVLLLSGKRSVRLDSGTDRSLHGVGWGPGADTWIVGDGGRLMRLMEDHVLTLTSGPTGAIRDMGTIGGALVAVGEWGRILRQRQQGFEEAQSPTKAAIAAVAPRGEGRLVGFGDYGAIVSISWSGAELVPSPSGHSWRDVVGDGRSFLAVGTDGGVLRGAPGAFQVTQLPDAGTLWSVSGTPDDAIAVGDGGLVLRLGAAGARRLDCGVDVGLRGVVRSGSVAWAVGEASTIVRVEDAGCTVERPPRPDAPTLEGVGMGPMGRPMAVGDDGLTLERSAEGGWEVLALDVGRVNLRNVVRTERDVYIVGAGGVILRHVLLDGS